MEFLNQHLVTEAYIKAWCDPETPNNGSYVWRVAKKDHTISMKSPKSLFSEQDFYTVYDSQGNRILELEHKLKEIEDKFFLLRDKKIKNHVPLTLHDRRTIALFVSTMFARTKRQKVENLQIWREYLEFVENLPKELSLMVKQTEEYKQVQESYIKQPMPFHIFHFVNITAPYLSFMNCAIFETNTIPGLVTSDNPCFWFDPEVSSNTPGTFFGVGSPTLNIILPVTPNQYLSLKRRGPDGYLNVHSDPKTELEIIDRVNGFTLANCEDYIVVNRKIFRDEWIDMP